MASMSHSAFGERPLGDGVFPPKQARSAATFQRILDATDALLRERDFEEISVFEICATAKVSVSSLYSRFEFLRLLGVRGADIVQPDICVVGGLAEMRRIATLAEAHYAQGDFARAVRAARQAATIAAARKVDAFELKTYRELLERANRAEQAFSLVD